MAHRLKKSSESNTAEEETVSYPHIKKIFIIHKSQDINYK